MSRDQQVRKEITVLAEISDFLHQERVGLLLHDVMERNMSGIQVILLGFLSALLPTCDHKCTWKPTPACEGHGD